VSGLCVTKLDVLDGMESVQLGVGYKMSGVARDILPFGAELLAECQPVYEEMPGWRDSTVGVTRFEDLPQAARNYLKRMEAVCEVPIDIVSTGADREHTIVRRNPFD
jgi:adenylosuccinate synthase